LPGWALAVVFALGFLVLGTGGFYGYRHFLGGKQTTASIAFESPPAAPAPAEKRSILAKYIEVTGLRLTEDSGKTVEAQFLVVNHSAADIASLAGNVTLRPRTDEEDEQAIGTFSFQVPSLGPYESRDLKATVDTNLRAYELPDWQFLRADVEITSP
jgi:hypothetical protein